METEQIASAEAAILARIADIRARIAAACAEAGRSVSEVTLMAVTKTVPPEQVNVAVRAGITLLGENRVQEFLSKRDDYEKCAEVQFIGHLQTNKVKQIVGKVTLIHSVDSLHLLEAVEKAASQQGIRQDILLEVNIGGEASKSGCTPNALPALLQAAKQCAHIRVRGLMTIPPPFENASDADACFAKMQQLYAEMQQQSDEIQILSMGMSGDFEAAIRHGATLIRLGSALFGARVYPPKNT